MRRPDRWQAAAAKQQRWRYREVAGDDGCWQKSVTSWEWQRAHRGQRDRSQLLHLTMETVDHAAELRAASAGSEIGRKKQRWQRLLAVAVVAGSAWPRRKGEAGSLEMNGRRRADDEAVSLLETFGNGSDDGSLRKKDESGTELWQQLNGADGGAR